MARTAQITDEMAAKAQQIAKQADSARQLRIALSVLIPKTCGASNAVTAQVLGIATSTVIRMQKQVREKAENHSTTKSAWGGRRRQLLSLEQEARFLAPWIDKHKAGEAVDVPQIQAALEKLVGRSVCKSTVYRMLARHGWRKAPAQARRRPKNNDSSG